MTQRYGAWRVSRIWHARRVLAAALALVWVAACGTLIAPYSLEAYKNATSLKAETLAMIAESGDPYSAHEDEVKALKIKLMAAQEFAAGMPKNKLSAAQWQTMNDPDGGLAGEYWVVWQRQGTVSSTAMAAQLRQIGDAFDEIICLEANKEKNTACVSAQ
ncbi:hypothetical protein E2493_15355 [Sphingomonas parva]|uniref:Uncharacterized protein n=1 Tax=Sphingomonas parva TaxID=2555898 RepID=A0A4Y8ZMY5_9SPHN|nr:hypothetical protein [Sphingomonas parva]TFI57360.1 hypothetical protein E2493_15355 [Sphingomonas parva]